MNELEAMWALTWRDLVRFVRDRAQVLGAFARPMLWLVFMGKGLGASVRTVSGVDYSHFVFAGAIAMSVLFGGMFQGVTIIWDREFGFLKEVLVAPIARVTIVLGKTLSGTVVTVVQGCLTVIFAPLVGLQLTPVTLLGLLGAITLLSLGITALGVVVATRMQTFEGFGVISNFVILPLYFLSGGVFPVDRLPMWMAVLVRVNPVTYGVDLMRHALDQPVVFSTGLDLLVLCGFAGAMIALSLAWFRRE
ncbi:MAG TPA: ABC transporter permease [Polyangiales bacterium]